MGIWPIDKTIVKFLKKSGKTDYSNPSSWRPISLTSHLGKVVERVIDRRQISDEDQQISSTLMSNNLVFSQASLCTTYTNYIMIS